MFVVEAVKVCEIMDAAELKVALKTEVRRDMALLNQRRGIGGEVAKTGKVGKRWAALQLCSRSCCGCMKCR